MTDLDRVRMHLAQAYTRSRDPAVDRHLSAALAELDGEPADDLLVECLHCGRVGLPEQVADCGCRRR
jgi:hypothetical protein